MKCIRNVEMNEIYTRNRKKWDVEQNLEKRNTNKQT